MPSQISCAAGGSGGSPRGRVSPHQTDGRAGRDRTATAPVRRQWLRAAVRTGSAFAALVRVPREALTIEGTLKTFSSIGGSGNPILRHFCPECGSSIAEEPGTRPGIIILNVGTFDDPTVAKPGREIFRDDAVPWIEVHGEIPRFAERPD